MTRLTCSLLLLYSLLASNSTSAPVSHSQQESVSFEQFGCKGNGMDETAPILKALAFAKQQGLPIYLQGKTYIFSPAATVDITGIPAFTGTGTLDMSNTGKAAGNERMTAVFQVLGTKKLLQKMAPVTKGQAVINIAKGLALKQNDIIYIASAEPLANRKRDYYCKGQRSVVKTYDPETGKLTVTASFYYTIQSACLWKLEYQPVFRVEKNLRFITSPMNFISCFRLYYAKGNFSGYYKNFALTAIMFKTSDGEVNEMEAELPVTDNNGYSHCIEVADMSSVIIRNCRLSGGRHVISGVGGGLWEKEECDGKGHAGYPSELEVDGGIYKGVRRANNINEHNATLDSHGLIEKMTIKNCTIYGGINLGANEVLVDNVTIYADEKRILNVGSDVLDNADWGKYTVRNSVFIGDKQSTISLIYGKANIKSLTLENIKVKNMSSSAYLLDFRYFAPRLLLIDNLTIENKPNRPLLISNYKEGIELKNSDIDKESIKWMN